MSAAMKDLAIKPSTAAAGYFVDQKKGEVNELKTLLKDINVERDVVRKREVIKKVIAYMTLGIDVTRLFTDMIMAIETKDVVIKKMVYLYLCNYAHSEPEMAIMCINSLRRDCDNEDPSVRGLALRSLCSLRLESILEYIEQPLQKSLRDISAYVRKTGVMGILKLNSLSPSLVTQNGYLERLYSILTSDPDATVVINAIYVINELQIARGGLEVNQTIVMSILNRIGEFSEWGLNTVLGLVARYKPVNEEEIYAIMNLLDPVLRTANSGAVLATFKCFIALTASMPELHPQIYQRGKPPMLTLITGAHAESQYCMLKHMDVVLRQPAARGVFDDEYRQFFVRYNEAPHVKHLKVDLLPLVTNHTNARDIASELAEYVTDVDAELARRAIRALGQIAMSIESVAEEMTVSLLLLIDMESSYVRAETAQVLATVVHAQPALSRLVLPYLSRLLKSVTMDEDSNSNSGSGSAHTTAKASLVWMIGEFGENIIEAPYMLEGLINHYDEEQSVEVKLQLLTAAMKLFFKRPPEMQAMLGRLFRYTMNESNSQDLHDRALLYYRLLSTDLKSTEEVFRSQSDSNNNSNSHHLHLEQHHQHLKQMFAEFNTLAVMYGAPSKQFIAEKYQYKMMDDGDDNDDAEDGYEEEEEAEENNSGSVSNYSSRIDTLIPVTAATTISAVALVPSQQSNTGANTTTSVAATVVASAPVISTGTVDLLDWEEHSNNNDNHSRNSTSGIHSNHRTSFSDNSSSTGSINKNTTVTSNSMILVDSLGRFTPVLFQQFWTKHTEAYNGSLCRLQSLPQPVPGSSAISTILENALRSQKINVMASGPLPAAAGGGCTGLKLFIYGIDAGGISYVAQVMQVNETGQITVIIKTDIDDGASVAAIRFAELIIRSLAPFSPQQTITV